MKIRCCGDAEPVRLGIRCALQAQELNRLRGRGVSNNVSNRRREYVQTERVDSRAHRSMARLSFASARGAYYGGTYSGSRKISQAEPAFAAGAKGARITRPCERDRLASSDESWWSTGVATRVPSARSSRTARR